MVQLKIVIKLHVRCDKCRSKAMETAADTDGVISVSLQGKYKDTVVVIGDRVDSASLAKRLGKKLDRASLETVEEMEKNDETKSKNRHKVRAQLHILHSSCEQDPCGLHAAGWE